MPHDSKHSPSPTPVVLLLALLAMTSCSSLDSTGGLGGDGVTLSNDADVLFGAAMTSTRPAFVDMNKLRASTTEWQTIQRDNVPRNSARYQLLVDEMRKSLRRRIRIVAMNKNIDLVVGKGDIEDANGLPVVDLTADVLQQP